MAWLWILIEGSIALILIYTLYLAALPRPLPGIPYNHESAKRLFGDIPLMKNERYRRQWIWSQPRQHGSAVSQVFLFPFRTPTIIVSDYREVMDICSRRSKEFDRGVRNKELFGVVTPNFHFAMPTADPQFKFNKKLVRDLMTTKFLNKVSAPPVYEKATALVALWNLKAFKAHGGPFEAGNDLYSATLDMICGVAFGMEDTKSALRHEIAHVQSTNPTFPTMEDGPVYFSQARAIPELEALLDIPKMVSIAQASPFPTFSQFLALLKPKHARAQWNRRALVKRQINRSLPRLTSAGAEGCKSALDQLLWREMNAAKEADRLPDYYSPAIRDEILGYLLGGHDTTAASLSWWVKFMSTYQSVQARLRDALRQAHSDAYRDSRFPTMEEICGTSIPYLDAVMEEALRCGSVATLIARTATCDTQILGYPIPKGADVILTVTGPSMTEPALPIPESLRSLESQESKDRVPCWEDDVSEFKPERWLKMVKSADGSKEEEVFDQNAGPTLIFSAGPRQCFGKRLAYMKLRTVMTLLIWNFEFQLLDGSLNSPDIHECFVNLPKDCYVKLAKV
ncbi:cytochrome P450 [Trichoderma sp. SZMC 28013]